MIPRNNQLGGVMVIFLFSRVEEYAFDPWLSKAKDCSISICCFFTRDITLKSKSKEVLDCNLDNVSECMEQHVYLIIIIKN